jgi:hypothetical protein
MRDWLCCPKASHQIGNIDQGGEVHYEYLPILDNSQSDWIKDFSGLDVQLTTP